MRPSARLFIILCSIAVLDLLMYRAHQHMFVNQQKADGQMREVIKQLGLSDLCIATDARYIRHISISDPVAPFMDHPGGIEHFPSSSIFVPIP